MKHAFLVYYIPDVRFGAAMEQFVGLYVSEVLGKDDAWKKFLQLTKIDKERKEDGLAAPTLKEFWSKRLKCFCFDDTFVYVKKVPFKG